MRPVRNRWPSTPLARNVRLVAQAWQEALSLQSFESFRVVTLDLNARLHEIIKISRDVRAERVPIRTLDPCLSELIATITRDSVASAMFSREIRLLEHEFSPGKINESNILSLVRFISSLLSKANRESSYKKSIEEALSNAVRGIRNSDLIRSLANQYCSVIINNGYSRQYILTETESHFFSREIKKVESRTLSRFMQRFDGSDRKFAVIIPINASAGDYIRKLGMPDATSCKFDELPLHVQTVMGAKLPDADGLSYVTFLLEAKDPFAALSVAVDTLGILISMTYLGRRAINHKPYYIGYVSLRRARSGELLTLERVALPSPSEQLPAKTLARVKKGVHKIFENFDQSSTRRLISAVNVSGLSRSSTTLENQLITIWSAIEVLLSDPPKGKSRVAHYVDVLSPCVCVGYASRYTLAVYSQLRLHYGRHIKAFFSRPEFVDDPKREISFMRLLFEDSLKPLHREFTTPLADNPLALYRLWKLESNFGTADGYLNSVRAHEKRVRWQLYRIYRIRNDIVHSGKMPTFLGPLVLNVYEYFRGSIGPIIGRAGLTPGRQSIDQIVAEMRFDYDMLKSDLAAAPEGVPLTQDQVLRFFD